MSLAIAGLNFQRDSETIGPMKLNGAIGITFAIGFAFFLDSCSLFYPETGPAAVVGTWTNAAGTVWLIKEDGTFEADLNNDHKRDAWGKYWVSGDTMTMLRKGGIKPKGCEGKGIYRFKRNDDDTLQFTFVSDKCRLRKQNVLLPWHRK